jgi:hypothetical protein
MTQSPLLQDSDGPIQVQVKPAKNSDPEFSSLMDLIRDFDCKSLNFEIHHKAIKD